MNEAKIHQAIRQPTNMHLTVFLSLQAQADEGLRHLRFRLVPKYCSEEEFWSRYFAAVVRVKEQVKAEQMWGDFDVLSEDEGHPQGKSCTLFAYKAHQRRTCHQHTTGKQIKPAQLAPLPPHLLPPSPLSLLSGIGPPVLDANLPQVKCV